MNKSDGRTVNPSVQEERRRVAFRMRDRGYSSVEICEVLGVNARSVREWFKRANTLGKEAAIAGGRRGVSYGTNRGLSWEQSIRIKQAMPDA